jgi:hypothetical protein
MADVDEEENSLTGDGRNMLPAEADLRKAVEFILGTPVFEHFNIKKDPLNNIIMRCESRLIKRPGLLTQNPLWRAKIVDMVTDFTESRKHVAQEDKQKSRKELAKEADEKRAARKKRLDKIVKGKSKGPPREVNKPIYDGVCSREKRYSVLMGTSSELDGAQTATGQNMQQTGDAVFASFASEPLTKPRRTLNTAYNGASKRRTSQVLGQSTNARAKNNNKLTSMGRPANRWTERAPTNRLPRLAAAGTANVRSCEGAAGKASAVPRRKSVVEEAVDKMVVVKSQSSSMRGLYRYIVGSKKKRTE